MSREMDWEQAQDYLAAKMDQMRFWDPEQGREQGITQFIEEKRFRPGSDRTSATSLKYRRGWPLGYAQRPSSPGQVPGSRFRG